MLIFLGDTDIESYWGSIVTCPGVLCSCVCEKGIALRHTESQQKQRPPLKRWQYKEKGGKPWSVMETFLPLVSTAEKWTRFTDNQQPPRLPPACGFWVLFPHSELMEE